MKSIILSKPDKILKGKIALPSSKSISNRLLMIRALSGKDFAIDNLSEADDTGLLQKLIAIISSGHGKKNVIEIDAAHAGTVMRFLTAWLAVKQGKWVLTGSERMKQRPIGILVEALNHLGASIDYLAKPGFPPLLIIGREISGSDVFIDQGVSSQFITALLLIAPYLPHGLTLHLKGQKVSTPYVDMTLRLMEYFGIQVKAGKTRIHVKPGLYKPREYRVESDWSAASFWYESAVFADEVDLELEGLKFESLQGDSILPVIYQNFGIRTEFTETGIRLTKVKKKIDGFYFDFTDCPDIAQPVIATCAGLGLRGRFEGLKSLQIKETDRVSALKNEIEKLGVQVIVSDKDNELLAMELRIPRRSMQPGLTFETYGDHRMAMAMAPLVLKADNIKILNPDVVVKSYPLFWEHLKLVGFEIR